MILNTIFTSYRLSSIIRTFCRVFEREFHLKDTKFSVKIKNIYKIEKTSYVSISIFGYKNKEKYPIYASRNTFKKHIDLLLLEKKQKRHYVLIKDFNTFMYDHTLNHRRKHIFRCLQATSTEKTLRCHVKDCFKINGKNKD